MGDEPPESGPPRPTRKRSAPSEGRRYLVDWDSGDEPRIVRANKAPSFAARIDLLRELVQVADAKTGAKRAPGYAEIADASEVGHDGKHVVKEANLRQIASGRTLNPGVETLRAIGTALAVLACRELQIPFDPEFEEAFGRYLAIGGDEPPSPAEILELRELHGNYQEILRQRILQAQEKEADDQVMALARFTDLDPERRLRLLQRLNDELLESGKPGLADRILRPWRKKR